MPKAPPPSVLLKYQGRWDYLPEKELDDWGLTPEQQVMGVAHWNCLGVYLLLLSPCKCSGCLCTFVGCL